MHPPPTDYFLQSQPQSQVLQSQHEQQLQFLETSLTTATSFL